MSGDPLEHPAKICGRVGREPKLAVVGHDLGQAVQRLTGHDAPLAVALFWPRIGKQDEYALDRRRWERRDQQARVIGKDSDILEVPPVDLRQEPADPVLEYLAAEEADFRMMLGLKREVLAPAKPDLEPNRSAPGTEQNSGIEPAR
jgi:hypothetical protein